VRPETFVQTNHRGMLRLYERVIAYLNPAPGMRLWEGYGGIGIMGSLAARAGAAVAVVEENRHSVHLGRHNAALNRLEVEFRAAQVEDALARERTGSLDAVLLDPPRAGLGPAVVAALARLRPEQLIYVSCEPSTLARDVAGLVRAGFRFRAGAVVDMFPHTAHVETVLQLSPGIAAMQPGALARP
jgi:23S rRNA (uracil1939-C5)-methyltransferase